MLKSFGQVLDSNRVHTSVLQTQFRQPSGAPKSMGEENSVFVIKCKVAELQVGEEWSAFKALS
jgi:hypothetical protein